CSQSSQAAAEPGHLQQINQWHLGCYRYHEWTFFVVTTILFEDAVQTNFSRWNNIVFHSMDPFDSSSWSNPVHFNFPRYTVFATGLHPWQVTPGITQTTIDLETGEVGHNVRYI
ncbi:uncharacterized protein A1O5_11284, partial [Cladophialophora psammophila CBS 110553]